jgi:hypothetical protein
VPFSLAVRLWDTYVAEGGRMKDFLTYVLAAFLLCWAPQLRAMDFQARPLPPPFPGAAALPAGCRRAACACAAERRLAALGAGPDAHELVPRRVRRRTRPMPCHTC